MATKGGANNIIDVYPDPVQDGKKYPGRTEYLQREATPLGFYGGIILWVGASVSEKVKVYY